MENYPLADKIWRRYNAAPGVISASMASGVLARATEFGTDGLPLLTDVRWRWTPSVSGLHQGRSSLVHAGLYGNSSAPDKKPLPIVSGRAIRSVGGPRPATSNGAVQTKAQPAERQRSQATTLPGSVKTMPPSIDSTKATFSYLTAAEEHRRSISYDKAPSNSHDLGAPLVNRKTLKTPPADPATETTTDPGGQQTGQRDSVDKITPKTGNQKSDLISLSSSGRVTTVRPSAINPGKKISLQSDPTSFTTVLSKTRVQRQPFPKSIQGKGRMTATGPGPHVLRDKGFKPDKATASYLTAAEEHRRSKSNDKALSESHGLDAPLVNRKSLKEPPAGPATETSTDPGGQQTGQRDSVDKITPRTANQKSDLISLSSSGKVTTVRPSPIDPGKKISRQSDPTSFATVLSKIRVQRQPFPKSIQAKGRMTATGKIPHVLRGKGFKPDKATADHPAPDVQNNVASNAPERIRRSMTESAGGKTEDPPDGIRAGMDSASPEPPAAGTAARSSAATGAKNLGIHLIERQMAAALISRHPAAVDNVGAQNIRNFQSQGMAGRTIRTPDHRLQSPGGQTAYASSVDQPLAARPSASSGATGPDATGNLSASRRSPVPQVQPSPMPLSVGEQPGAEKNDLSGSSILSTDPVTASAGKQPVLMPSNGTDFHPITSTVQPSGTDQSATPIFLKTDPGFGMLMTGRLPHTTAAHRTAPFRKIPVALWSQSNSRAAERIFTAPSDAGDLPANESVPPDAAKFTSIPSHFEIQAWEQVLRRATQKSESGFQIRRQADPMVPARLPIVTHQNPIGGMSEPNPTAGVYRRRSILSQAAGDLIHLAAADSTQSASASVSQSSVTPAASARDEGSAPETTPGRESIDMERLADEVYAIIERRLIIERERLGQ